MKRPHDVAGAKTDVLPSLGPAGAGKLGFGDVTAEHGLANFPSLVPVIRSSSHRQVRGKACGKQPPIPRL